VTYQPRFDQIDLSRVAPPAALDAWGFEAILAARMADFAARMKAAGLTYDVAALESDPAKILQETDSYREGLVRQRVNDAVESTYLLRARGADLDLRAAEYHTARAPGEGDDSLRLRAWLAWEALSLGGSYGGYEYFARSAAPLDLLDVAVYGHGDAEGVARGEVRIVCLGAGGLGTTPSRVLAAVRAKFPRHARKVNDFVNVVAAQRATYAVDATLVLPHGADGAAVLAAQRAQLDAYRAARGVIGGSVSLGGLMGALGHDDPNLVIGVEMRAPYAGVIDIGAARVIGGDPLSAPICTGVSLDWRSA
jgi:phage-related baseplate assembly protein